MFIIRIAEVPAFDLPGIHATDYTAPRLGAAEMGLLNLPGRKAHKLAYSVWHPVQ